MYSLARLSEQSNKRTPEKCLFSGVLARLARFERAAFRLGGGPSILLRYRQMCQNYSTIQKLLQKIFDAEIIPKTIPDII